MAQKNVARHKSDCPKAFETTVSIANSSLKVPAQKRKEDAKETLYITRI